MATLKKEYRITIIDYSEEVTPEKRDITEIIKKLMKHIPLDIDDIRFQRALK